QQLQHLGIEWMQTQQLLEFAHGPIDVARQPLKISTQQGEIERARLLRKPRLEYQ
ncbi:hypothetical protein WH5701_16745, partial [Synechococcus sp. WH 5701]